MVIKIIFSKSVSGSDEYASFINEDVKTYIKKDDTTQRLKKFGTLLPK
jgi:predicted alpha/beta superfamily hydrolase